MDQRVAQTEQLFYYNQDASEKKLNSLKQQVFSQQDQIEKCYQSFNSFNSSDRHRQQQVVQEVATDQEQQRGELTALRERSDQQTQKTFKQLQVQLDGSQGR